jgi:hypothetical protein
MSLLFPVEPVALCDLADHSGLGFADVAALSDIPSSTLSRWWKDPHWVARSNGATLQQIVTTVPNLCEYLIGRGLTTSVQRPLRTLSASGVALRPIRIPADQASAFANALSVAAAIVNGDRDELFRRLSLGWGLGHDKFIDAVLAPGPTSLFTGDEVLRTNALTLHEPGTPEETSTVNVVGYAVLAHKLMKYVGDVPLRTTELHSYDMRSAFVYRSATMARLLRDGDPDLARRYNRDVHAHHILARNEQWSLLTFASGRRLPRVFGMPVTTPHHIHQEVIRDVFALNEGYLTYLCRVAIPTAQLFGPSHPESRARLSAALEERLSTGISDKKLRHDLADLNRGIIDYRPQRRRAS